MVSIQGDTNGSGKYTVGEGKNKCMKKGRKKSVRDWEGKISWSQQAGGGGGGKKKKKTNEEGSKWKKKEIRKQKLKEKAKSSDGWKREKE